MRRSMGSPDRTCLIPTGEASYLFTVLVLLSLFIRYSLTRELIWSISFSSKVPPLGVVSSRWGPGDAPTTGPVAGLKW